MSEFTLRIDGMHCGSCIRRVSQTLASIGELKVEEVSLGTAHLEADNSSSAAALAINALAQAGYKAQLEQ